MYVSKSLRFKLGFCADADGYSEIGNQMGRSK